MTLASYFERFGVGFYHRIDQSWAFVQRCEKKPVGKVGVPKALFIF